MTKTGLQQIMGMVYVHCRYTDSEHRLNRCKAWYYTDEDMQAVALRSYNTMVAIYWRGVVWERDRYSNTTSQHVRRFGRLMDAPVISLYRRSGMSKSDFDAHTACDWQDVIDAVLNA